MTMLRGPLSIVPSPCRRRDRHFEQVLTLVTTNDPPPHCLHRHVLQFHCPFCASRILGERIKKPQRRCSCSSYRSPCLLVISVFISRLQLVHQQPQPPTPSFLQVSRTRSRLSLIAAMGTCPRPPGPTGRVLSTRATCRRCRDFGRTSTPAIILMKAELQDEQQVKQIMIELRDLPVKVQQKHKAPRTRI